jgi:hypothetical protein
MAATTGTPLILAGTVAPTNATNKNIVWSVKTAGAAGAEISTTFEYYDGHLITTSTFAATAAGTAVITATVNNGLAPGTNYTKDFTITVAPPFVPVINITGVPTTSLVTSSDWMEFDLDALSTVAPANATNKTIIWSVKDAGTTDTELNSAILWPKAAGTLVLTATITDGLGVGNNYTQDFTIIVSNYVYVTNITGVPTSFTVGTPLNLTGTVVPDNATYKTIEWSIVNAGSTGATLSGSTLNTTAPGTVKVEATVEGGRWIADYTQEFTISIAPPFVPVTTITGVPTDTVAGTPLALTGTVAPADATNSTIVWSIAEAGGTGASLSGNTLNTTAAGTIIVTATVVNGTVVGTNYTKNFYVTVAAPLVPVTNITGVPATATVGTPLNLTSVGVIVPANATNRSINWSMKDAGTTGGSIETAFGYIDGVSVTTTTFNATSAGTAVITATVTNGTAVGTNYTQDFTITVSLPFVAVTNITGVQATADVGMLLWLTRTIVPENATNKDIDWSVKTAGTTGGSIRTIDVWIDGVLTPMDIFEPTAAGTAVITATISGGSAPGIAYTQDFTITVSLPFVGVTNITGVPTTAVAGTPLALSGTVTPADATNSTIIWSVANAGTTGATISGSTLNTTAAGTVTVTATVVNGATVSTNYMQNFTITVAAPPDITAPTLIAGAVNRSSDTAATGKFTSNEAGSYYYTIAATAPADSAAVKAADGGAGVAVAADAETTLSLTTLTAGQKTVYVVVEDAAGNLSAVLALTIPALTASLSQLDYDLSCVTYDGNAKPLAVSAASGVTGLGTTTVKYRGVAGTVYAETTTAPTDAGTYAVTVDIAAGTNYTAAAGLALGNYTIGKAPAPAITWPTAADLTYGAALSDSALTGGTTAYGSFAWTNGAAIPIVNNSGYSVTFTPTTATQNNYLPVTPLTQTVDIIVHPAAAPVFTFPTGAKITEGQALSAAVFTGGTGNGSFAFADPTAKPGLADSGTAYAVTFTPADTANYDYSNFAPGDFTQDVVLTVVKKTETVDTGNTGNTGDTGDTDDTGDTGDIDGTDDTDDTGDTGDRTDNGGNPAGQANTTTSRPNQTRPVVATENPDNTTGNTGDTGNTGSPSGNAGSTTGGTENGNGADDGGNTTIGNEQPPRSDGDGESATGFPLWPVILGIIAAAAIIFWLIFAKRRRNKEEEAA